MGGSKGVLYLVALKGIYRLLPGPDIPATSYTCTLRMPTSQMVEYVHFGYETRFYSEFFAEVEFGVVVRTRNEFNNPYQLFLDELVRRFDFKKDRLSDAAWTAINSRTLQGYGTKRIAKLLPNLDVQITIGATNRGKELNLNHQIYEMARKFGFEVRDEKSTSDHGRTPESTQPLQRLKTWARRLSYWSLSKLSPKA